jgi:hypothetical protein
MNSVLRNALRSVTVPSFLAAFATFSEPRVGTAGSQRQDGLRTTSVSKRFSSSGVAALAVTLGLVGCGSVQKVELDREVDRLCAIDGGVHIYEVVRLPKEHFGSNGEVFPQYRGRLLTEGRFGPAFGVRFDTKVLVAGDPSLIRRSTSILRKSDNKVLGEIVTYGRRGGDGLGPGEPSSHVCPRSASRSLEAEVFEPEEK